VGRASPVSHVASSSIQNRPPDDRGQMTTLHCTHSMASYTAGITLIRGCCHLFVTFQRFAMPVDDQMSAASSTSCVHTETICAQIHFAFARFRKLRPPARHGSLFKKGPGSRLLGENVREGHQRGSWCQTVFWAKVCRVQNGSTRMQVDRLTNNLYIAPLSRPFSTQNIMSRARARMCGESRTSCGVFSSRILFLLRGCSGGGC
jgi:hypothetical protein